MAEGQGEQELPDFGEGSYWEEHYVKAAAEGEDVYDWLVGWTQLQWILEPLMGRDPRCAVLHLGNGNSPLPEEMFDAGYKDQTAVDISEAATLHMAARNRQRASIRWITADCRNLIQIPSDHYPLVVDKSTLDAFFCNDQHALAIMEFLKEAYRVTATGGTFVSVSMHRPKAVLPWLRHRLFRWRMIRARGGRGATSTFAAQPHWEEDFPGGNKRCKADESLEAHWPRIFQQVTLHPDSDLSSSDESDSEED
ncbi:unnamed protein product [Effrenium voratum]|uniref:Methyltransferase type 11 domain-containing protein n=1 Tax=Effrenium voratum TaxID=2562239 RepID=A0AA36IIW5_9DINO|nr:unnamed protein product [Effrenium voratum]